MTKQEKQEIADILTELEFCKLKSKHIETAKEMLRALIGDTKVNVNAKLKKADPIPVPKDPIKKSK